MTPDDVWTKKVRIGSRVRVSQTGKEYTVQDILDMSVHGTKVAVFVEQDLYYDISELELC